MDDERDRFDNEVLAHMIEVMESGHNPLDVIKHLLVMGYTALDAARLALKFEALLLNFSKQAEDLTEDEIRLGAAELVAGVESYLMNSGG